MPWRSWLANFWLCLVGLSLVIIAPLWIALWFSRNTLLGLIQVVFVSFALYRLVIAPAVSVVKAPRPPSEPPRD